MGVCRDSQLLVDYLFCFVYAVSTGIIWHGKMFCDCLMLAHEVSVVAAFRDVPGSIFYRVPGIKTVFYRVRVPSI